MKIYQTQQKSGIVRSLAFAEKQLAQYAVNVGTRCGHGCQYCSSPTLLRMHPSFKKIGESPFASGYAIVDPDTPQRVAKDAQKIQRRGMIQLCTTVDAWAPEAKAYDLGRRCLQAILNEPAWQVRILTKNAAVADDFDLVAKYRERVLVGLSITATADQSEVIEIIEPHASSISERMHCLAEAATLGLRTYAMFCPLLPGIADSPEQMDQLVRFAVDCQVEEIFIEPVNSRGPGLKRCQEALELGGYTRQAQAIDHIRNQQGWSRYVVELLSYSQQSVRKYFDMTKLRFLLYPSRLRPCDREQIKKDDAGVIWL